MRLNLIRPPRRFEPEPAERPAYPTEEQRIAPEVGVAAGQFLFSVVPTDRALTGWGPWRDEI